MTKIEAYTNKCITKDYSTNTMHDIWLKIDSNKHVRDNNLDKNIIDIIKNCKYNTIFLWIGNNEDNEQYYNIIEDIAKINKVYVIISEPDKSKITVDNILAHAVRKIDNIDGFLCIIKDDKKAYYKYGVLPVIEIDNYKHIANSFIHCFWKKACSEKIGKSKWKEYDFNEVNEQCSIESNLPKDSEVEYSNESIGQPNIITIPFISDKDRIINSLISSNINDLTLYVNFYKGNETDLIKYDKLYSLNESSPFYRVLIDENNGDGKLFLINPIEEMDINNNRYYIELNKRQCSKFSEMFHANIEYEFFKEISLDKLVNNKYYDEKKDERVDFKSEITEILDRPKVYDEFISKEHMENTIHNEIESYIPKACKVKFIYDIVPKKINNKHDIYKQYKEVNDKIKNKIEQINELIEKYKTNDEIKNISDCISYDTNELLSIHNTLSNFNTLNQINNCRSIKEIAIEEQNINEYLGKLNPLINNLKNGLKEKLSSIKTDIEKNKKQKDNYRNQINNLKKEITTNKSDIDGNKKKIQDLEAINKKLEESKNSNNSNQDNNVNKNKNKNKNKIKLSKITTDVEEITKKIQDNLEKIKGFEEKYNELQKDLGDKEHELENLEKVKEKLNSILFFLEKKFIVPSEKQNIHIPNKNDKKGDSILANIIFKKPEYDIPGLGILLQDNKNNQLYLGIKYWEELDDAKKEINEKYKKAKICVTDVEEE